MSTSAAQAAGYPKWLNFFRKQRGGHIQPRSSLARRSWFHQPGGYADLNMALINLPESCKVSGQNSSRHRRRRLVIL